MFETDIMNWLENVYQNSPDLKYIMVCQISEWFVFPFLVSLIWVEIKTCTNSLFPIVVILTRLQKLITVSGLGFFCFVLFTVS